MTRMTKAQESLLINGLDIEIERLADSASNTRSERETMAWAMRQGADIFDPPKASQGVPVPDRVALTKAEESQLVATLGIDLADLVAETSPRAGRSIGRIFRQAVDRLDPPETGATK